MKKLAFVLLGADYILFLLIMLVLGFPYMFSRQDAIDLTNLSGQYDPYAVTAFFENQPVETPKYLAQEEKAPAVLGETTASKRIEVDLASQRLYAYEGDKQVYNFLVSTGKWNRTPTGNFSIWTKLRYTKMSGGSKALRTYYYLPNVPYTMFFSGGGISKAAGYGIHGTYWHSNFGHPMSHGCINMKTEEAGLLYFWAQPDLRGGNNIAASADNPGTHISIYGKAPLH